MGLERQSNGTWECRCDECDRVKPLESRNVNTSKAMLRKLQWIRVDYIDTAHHYVYRCPKCRIEAINGNI